MNDVTVCIPSIPPRADLLTRALASVASQTAPPAAIAIAHDLDGVGAARTRNRTIEMATTEWVAFLDDDDEMYPHHLATLLAHQARTGADLVYPWMDIVGWGDQDFNDRDPLGMFGQPYDADELDRRNYIPVTYLVRRSLALEVGGFPELESERWPHDNCEDWGFLRDFRDAGGVMSHVAKRTWAWHWNGRNTSGKPWRAVASAV